MNYYIFDLIYYYILWFNLIKQSFDTSTHTFFFYIFKENDLVAEQSSAERVVLVESVWVDSDKTNVCSNSTPSWKDVELGYLPNGNQADVASFNIELFKKSLWF